MRPTPKQGIVDFFSFSSTPRDDLAGLRNFRQRDWKHALGWLDDAGLAFYFLQKIKDTNMTDSIPPGVVSRLEQNFAANRQRVDNMAQRLDSLNKQFDGAGVRYAVLKGLSLIPQFCPDAYLRHQGDFDYLIDDESLAGAQRVVVEAGYIPKPSISKQEFIFLMPGTGNASRSSAQYSARSPHAVELHLDIWESDLHRLQRLQGLFSVNRTRTHRWNGLTFPVLTDADAFLLQVLHACHHLFTYWVRMSCFLEIGFFLNQRAADTALWDGVTQRVGDNVVLREFVVVISELVAQIFAAPLPHLIRTWGNSVRPATRVWIENYAQDCAFCELPTYEFRLLPKTKLILFLHQQYRDDMPAGKVLVRNRLIPSSRLGQIVSSVRNNPSLVLNRQWRKRQRLVRRAVFHALSGLRYLCEIPRWLWLNRDRAHSTAT
jgi:hypothetical protein